MCCAGCAPRLLFFCSWHGKSINAPPGLRANLQQLGGRLSRARDFCWGSPRPDGKMHVGALEFQFPAWLAWPVFFLSLGEGHRGTEGTSRGLQSSGTDRQMEGAPPCDYDTGTPSGSVYSANGRLARRTDGWSSPRISHRQTNKPTYHKTKQNARGRIADADADAEVSSRAHSHERVHVKVHIFVASAHGS